MIYIKSIEIENFQSHEFTKIDFSSNLNVIVGPSDNGKSAIIRALKWVLFNEPKGTEFIRFGASYCRVSILLSNGIKIIRERTKSKNLYKLIEGENETIYEGFGNDIPLEILEAHKIKKIQIDKDTNICLNISEQLEGPFLLSQPNSFKSKAIGRIVGLHIIDEAIKEINKEISSIQVEKRNLKDELDNLDKQIKDLEYIYELENLILKKETLIKKIEDKLDLLDKLKYYKELINQIDQEIDYEESLVSELRKIEKIDLELLEIKVYNYTNSTKLLKNMKLLAQEIKNQKDILNNTSNLEHIEIKLKMLENYLKKYIDIIDYYKKYKLIDNEIENNRIIEIETKNVQEINNILVRLEKIISKYSALNDKHQQLNLCINSINKGNEYMKKFRYQEECQNKIVNIEKLYNVLSNIITLKKDFDMIEKEFKALEQNYKDCSQNIYNLTEEYKNILKNISVCPLCGSDIDELKIDKILESI